MLQKNSSILSQTDLEVLLAYTINQDKQFLVTNPEYKLSFWEYLKFRYYIYKRKNNYPLAYITGQKEFYGLDFTINEDVLVPRPETEQMVELALAEINNLLTNQKSNSDSQTQILLADIGTGSGCIPISILKTIQEKNNNLLPQIKTTATDISKKALEVAKKNTKKHQVDIDLRKGSLADPILKELHDYENIIITANLPYLIEEEFNSEASIKKEPKQALIAENGGLEHYEELLKQLNKVGLKGKNLVSFFEINPNQSEKIQEIICKYLKNADVQIKKDLKRLDRLVMIKN